MEIKSKQEEVAALTWLLTGASMNKNLSFLGSSVSNKKRVLTNKQRKSRTAPKKARKSRKKN